MSKKKNNKVVWDSLRTLYTETMSRIELQKASLIAIEENFSNVLAVDKSILKELQGAGLTTVDLFNELNEIVKQHSASEVVNDETVFHPYVGNVNIKSDAHMKVYLNLVVAYEGVNDKINSITENVISHLLGLINESATVNKIELSTKAKSFLEKK